jgi:ABC-type multidrug transport system fused ATPase/permease subunit
MKDCIRKNKGILFITVLLNIISSAAAVFLAKLLQKVIDAAISRNMTAFQRILVVSLGYIIVLGVLSYLYSLCSKRLIRNFTKMLRQKAFYGILKRNVPDFTGVNTADYISAFTNDIKLIEENYIIPSLMTLQYTVMFIVTLVMLFKISPLIALCLIGCMIVMLVLPGLMGNSLQMRQDALSKQLSVFTSRLKDFFSGYEVIRSFQIGDHIKQEFVNENDKTADTKYRADKLFALNEGVSGILAYLTQFSGLFIGAYLIIKGNITAGTLVALIQLSGTFVSPVMMILQSVPKIKSIDPVIKRMDELADYTDTSFMGTLMPTFTDSIAIRDLSFAYDEKQPVLISASLTLHKGKKYAIVGKSGCGKTTLVKLLTGNYSSYTGSITYDDTSLCDLDIEKIQNMASVIHQNIYMFDDSIRQNICLYDTFTDKDLDSALKISGAEQFLERIPDGLLSKAGENGSNLSGGQRQRVAVARALIRHKPILILDEGTSAVDMQTAYDIESRLIAIRDLTLITITHNLSEDLLGQYDQIVYMEDGAVAETGSLTELLSKQGGFYHFVNLQK